MPIVSSDIKLKLSVKTGSAGNSATSNIAGSLGKYISTTEIVDATLNNLFEDVTGDENASSNVDYKCFFIHNAHATLTMQTTKIWFQSQVSGGTTLAMALDNIAASAIGATSAQAAEIATKNDAPSGVGSYSSPTDKASGITVGDIAPGQCRAIWVRRTAANTVAVNSDGAVVRVECDSNA